MEVIRIALSGATGRMERAISKLIVKDSSEYQNLELVNNNQDFDVFVDFSAPTASIGFIERCLELNKPMVIGTTGFADIEFAKIKQASLKIPILYSANMSVGVNLCNQLLAKVSKVLNPKLGGLSAKGQVAISDLHHKYKKDAPSGTALAMGNVVLENSNINREDIQFNATRAGEIVGEHSVRFILDDEEIIITHKAFTRDIFADGALMAAKWLYGNPAGFYSIADLVSSYEAIN